MTASHTLPLFHKQADSASVESGFEGSSYTPVCCGDISTRGDPSGDPDNFFGMSQQTKNAQPSPSGPHDVDLGSIMIPQSFHSLQDPFFQNAHLAFNNSDYQSRPNTSGLGFPVTSGSHSSASNATYSPPSRSPEGVEGSVNTQCNSLQINLLGPTGNRGDVYTSHVSNGGRNRKIGCDGARPMCRNCGRRADIGELCSYDPKPKRRGPDRQPGARKRSTTGVASDRLPRRRRRNLDSSSTATRKKPEAQVLSTGYAVDQTLSAIFDDISGTIALPQTEPTVIDDELFPLYNDGHEGIPVIPYNASAQFQQAQPLGSVPNIGYDADNFLAAFSSISCPLVIGDNRWDEELDERIEDANVIGAEPGLQFTRETWWDALLSQYALIHDGNPSLTVGLRETASRRIMMDLRKLFHSVPFWFNFINVPRFFGALLDPSTRNTLQPSLILSALAVATFVQSSESGLGLRGRVRALALQEQAQSALEASLNAGWIDCGLVQASLLIGFFEISAHPLHNTERTRSALGMLDALVRSLGLTALDADDPRVSVFLPHLVPTVPASSPALGIQEDQWNLSGPNSPQGCSCSSYTLVHACPEAVEYAPLMCGTSAWTDVSEGEIRKEECRRLAWSSLMIAASHSSYTSSDSAISPQMDLFIMDPANVACVRMRLDPSLSDAEKAQFAFTAWLEMDAIENAMARHTCSDTQIFLQGREILFNSRMHISFDFQRYIPQAYAGSGTELLFYDKKAEDWLKHQAGVARHFNAVVNGLSTRPFLIFWLLSQITRCLTLWSYNSTLTLALDVAKSFLICTEHLMAIWPCPAQYRRYKILHERLTPACYAAGVPPPPAGLIASPMLL
ncbi:hypothetical protein A0H81_09169 [Grifola frondosa]|uniref:Transcription factor domain-containing protein n=1 Tax=Grifola frondosa TaxID=5627 RepID=A0A1C7M770_GRIFR|nr:hypothetical protein A0H81_09169 [Grifola frondosa]